jgi:hypothetical protein
MKKLLNVILCLTILFSLVACAGGGDSDDGDNTPIYSEVLSFDENGHWYAQLNGSGKKNYEEHRNDMGRCECGKYFETDDVLYELRYTLDGDVPNFYYVAVRYLSENYLPDLHIEIPAYHCQSVAYDYEDPDVEPDPIIEEFAEEIPYPVLEIASNAFKGSGIESIKLNDGLKKIGGGAFNKTFIEEFIIPDSVEGTIYNVCGDCVNLKKVVIGEGITIMDGYNFSGCGQLRDVKIGSNVTEIQRRNFYACKSIRYLVLPKSVISIPEDEIYAGAVGKYVTMNNLFQGGSPPALGIFLEITKEEYEDILIPLRVRDDKTGLVLDEVTGLTIPHADLQLTTYGFCEGWNYGSELYFKGEWIYDENGEPKPII